MFSGSVDAGFVLALPFHHGDLEPDCRGFDEGGLMCGIKILLQDFALKMQGGSARGGAYLRDTIDTVYSNILPNLVDISFHQIQRLDGILD